MRFNNSGFGFQSRLKLLALLLLFAVPGTGLADLPKGFFIDHGYTYFTVESVSETANGKRVDRGFKLSGEIRLFGNAPAGSSIKLILKKNGKTIAERRTNTKVLAKGHPSLKKTVNSTAAGTQQPHLLSGKRHEGALDVVNTGTGEYKVDVVYIDGASGKEYHAHTYTIYIGKVDKLDAIANKQVVKPPEYFVSRHQEALSTILSSWLYYDVRNAGGNYVLLWNSSPKKIDTQTSTTRYLSCTVDGKPVKLYNEKNPQAKGIKNLDGTEESRETARELSVRHLDRNALKYRRGSSYKEDLVFNQNRTRLPFNDKTDDYPPKGWDQNAHLEVSLADHPGHWECQWLDNGKLIRSFAWSVAGNGQLVPHAEQKKGLTLNPGAILVDTYIPQSGAEFDARLVPEMVKQGGFYGWKWKSSKMKKLADEVPEIGKPWPLPSAQAFVPKPGSGSSESEKTKAKREADARAAAEKRKADKAAKAAQLKAEQQAYDAKMKAQAEANEKLRQETYDKEFAKAQAEAAEAVKQANESAAEAMRQAQQQAGSPGALDIMFRILLSVSLILVGILLVANKLPQLSGMTNALLPVAGALGLAIVGISLIDLLIDLIALRPIIGDGLPQVSGFASGALLAQERLSSLLANEKVSGVLNTLKQYQATLGFASIGFGVVHLLLGGFVLV